MQRAADEVGEALSHHAGITTAQLKVGEDAEANRRVCVECGAREPDNIFGAREAEELLNIGGA
jgi:hypothetical protein